MHRMYEEELERSMKMIKTKNIDEMDERNDYNSLNKDVDMVNHPPHYTEGYKEVIEMMKDVFGTENLAMYCTINAFKYRMRAGKKSNLVEDIKKAEWYEAKAKELNYLKSFLSPLDILDMWNGTSTTEDEDMEHIPFVMKEPEVGIAVDVSVLEKFGKTLKPQLTSKEILDIYTFVKENSTPI